MPEKPPIVWNCYKKRKQYLWLKSRPELWDLMPEAIVDIAKKEGIYAKTTRPQDAAHGVASMQVALKWELENPQEAVRLFSGRSGGSSLSSSSFGNESQGTSTHGSVEKESSLELHSS